MVVKNRTVTMSSGTFNHNFEIFLVSLMILWLVTVAQPEDYADSYGSSAEDEYSPLVTIGNLTTPICLDQHVCPARTCGIFSSEMRVCQCDTLCTFFGDCCPHFTDEIPVNCKVSVTNRQSYIESYDQSFFSCEIVKSKALVTKSYIVISKCPSTWKDNQIREKCEASSHPKDFDLEDIPLSYESTVSYKNVYCVVCNGLDPQTLNPWHVNLICPTEMVEAFRSSPISFQEILHHDNCTFYVSPPLIESGGTSARSCFRINPDKTYIDSCPPSSDPELTVACESLTAPIKIFRDSFNVSFKNPACYACSVEYFRGYNDMCKKTTPGEEIPSGSRPPPISVLFDFSSGSNTRLVLGETVVSVVTLACNPGEVYDPYSESCLMLTCPQGYTISNGTCIREASEDELVCHWLRHDANYIVSFTITSKDPGVCADFGTGKEGHIQDLVEKLKLTSFVECVETRSDGQYVTLFIWAFDNNYTAPLLDPVVLEYENIGNGAQHAKNLSKVSFYSFFVTSNSPATIMKTLDNTLQMTTSPPSNPTNKLHHANLQSFNETTYELNGQEYAKTESRFFCNFTEAMLTCPSTEFNLSLFVPFGDDGRLKYEPSGDIISPKDYILLNGGMIRVCQFLSQNGTVNETTTYCFLQYSTKQTNLTFACTTLSLASLVFTLLSYTVFPSLRKQVTNHLIMALCATVFVAQSFLLFGGLVNKVSQVVCSVFAVASHFSWLTVFTLSTTIAVDLCRTFGSQGTFRIPTANRKLFLVYLSVALGVPFLIVSVTLVLSIVIGDDIDLHYGDRLSCWIGDGQANLYAFGIPVFTLLCLNMFFFVKTIHGIAQSKKVSMTLHEGKKAASYTDQLVKISIKISSIMGFTWLFGFIAAFGELEQLWYIFIILNGLQGVYIFLAFTATRQVYDLWKDLLFKMLYNRQLDARSEKRLPAKADSSSV